MPNELVISNPWQLIDRLSATGQSVDTLREVMNMALDWDKEQAKKRFAEQIRLFQAKCPAIEKKSPVPNNDGSARYKFASYEDIMTIIQPILAECEIVPTFSFEYKDKLLVTTCHIRVGTHVEDTTLPLGIPDIPKANESQKGGGATSYGKRYSLVAALNIRIVGEDRDGVGLVGYISAEEAQTLDSLMKEVAYFSGQPFQRGPFLNWLVEGLETVEELPSDKLVQAMMELNRKRQEAIRSKKK